jgi:hypothetical protein
MVMVMMVMARECTCLVHIWETVVCIATNYRLAGPGFELAGSGFEYWQWKRFFSSPKQSRKSLEPTQPTF